MLEKENLNEFENAKVKIVEWLGVYLSDLTGIELAEIDLDGTFDRYGIDSYHGVVMMHELGEWLGRELEPGEVFEHPSIAELAAHLAADSLVRTVLSGRV